MASNEVVSVDGDISQIIEAGKLFAKGRTAQAVGAELGVSTQKANKLYAQYQQMAIEAAKGGDLGDRLSVALEESLQHYEILLEEAWQNKQDAENNFEFTTVNTSLRLIKDIVNDRFKMLSSMVDGQDVELLEELEEMERFKESLETILKELRNEFPDAAKWFAKRLRDEVGGVEVVQ